MSFINEHRDRFGVEPICETLQVAPSTYYAALARPPSARQLRDRSLKVEIARVHKANFDVYGTEKVWKQLRREKVEVGRDRVGRLMAELELEGAVRGKTWRTTIPTPATAGRPGRPRLQRDGAQPALGCRPHLRQHLARRRLHGFRHRRLQSLHRWLEGLDHFASRARARRLGDGDLVKRHYRPQGPGPSFRPRGPVPRHSLHRTPGRRRRGLLGRVARRFL